MWRMSSRKKSSTPQRLAHKASDRRGGPLRRLRLVSRADCLRAARGLASSVAVVCGVVAGGAEVLPGVLVELLAGAAEELRKVVLRQARPTRDLPQQRVLRRRDP